MGRRLIGRVNENKHGEHILTFNLTQKQLSHRLQFA